MIHDILPHVFNNQYLPQPPSAESYGLVYDKKSILIRKNEDGTFELPTSQELEAANEKKFRTFTYLFSIDNQSFYLLKEDGKHPPGFTWATIAETMKSAPRHLSFAAVTGYQLYNWYENRKYCGRCGCLTVKDDKIRCISCPSCKQMEYPKIAPAVIVGVTNGNRLLLAGYPNYDKYALLAGFVEIGETLEETVRREVMEEVGLKVRNIRYYKSQPWAISDNLLMGYFCDVDGSNQIHFDKNELSNAEWFDRKDIPSTNDDADGSLTHDMIIHFKNGNI